MRFNVYGPYEVPLEYGDVDWLDPNDLKFFWEEIVEQTVPRLSSACGVYIFGMTGAEGRKKGIAAKTLPWYVGKAEKQTFKEECFNSRNLNNYNKTITTTYKNKGRPLLYLLARHNDDGEFSKTTKEEYPGVQFVERMMIQMSLASNNQLLNTDFTKDAKTTNIRGFIHDNTRGRDTSSVRQLKETLNMQDRKPIHFSGSDNSHWYEVHGPYKIPMETGRRIAPDDIDQMWQSLPDRTGLKYGCGVYVVALRKTANIVPWLVGSSKNGSFIDHAFCGFREMFNLNSAIKNTRGEAIVFFVTKVRKQKSLVELEKNTATHIQNIGFVKSMLLEYAVQANKDVISDEVIDMEMMRGLYVEGFVNSARGQPRIDVRSFKKFLGV